MYSLFNDIYPKWVSGTLILNIFRKGVSEDLQVVVFWKNRVPGMGGGEVVRKKNSFLTPFLPHGWDSVFFRTLKLASLLSPTSWNFSESGFWILTKGSHLKKKAASFRTLSKRGGGGPTQIQKFWGSFFGAFFWTFSIEGGGVEPIPKGFG